ncbi:hypothetical protein [Paraflavitalea sp. CAU 1676]|uniref:hypothetical protein n=1 Tax=Paraflavitalea sp. CAU 1676 TaxID=3032598 RepID=UPI0023DA545C|nr:hypothetical protein [Paraflavitalea sp. CAU 1676]MDF2192716.1 hypothetical protein [Paraflavitalea sp. CAU 1676]
MKKVHLFLIALLITTIAAAQTPQLINYQAVARNNSGQALANQTIKIRISLNAADANSAMTFYSETRTVTTNTLGLFNVQIGASGASSTYGNISNTEWTDGSKTRTIRVELDVNNSGVFTDMGSQQLVSVPFALAANTAVNSTKIGGRTVDAVSAPTNGQVLTWSSAAGKWQPSTIASSAPVFKVFTGQVNNIIASSPNWIFIGQSQDITLNAGQYIGANFSAVLGLNSGTANQVSLCACYQSSGGGTISPFTPTTFMEAPITATRLTFSFSGAVVPGSGTYKVGACVRNNSGVALNGNDYYSGYIQAF